MCMPRCQSDQQCAQNEKCLSGNCIRKYSLPKRTIPLTNKSKNPTSLHTVTCRVDNDCFLGQICQANRCITACHNDDDCIVSESCRNSTCLNPCASAPCGPNAICTVANHRASCSCPDGPWMANPTPTYGCVRTPALACASANDCPAGFGCADDLCRPACTSDTQCVSNERCERGVCKPMCRRDDECRNGDICQDLTCVAGCRTDTECAGHLACQQQQCVDPCSQPGRAVCGSCAECSVSDHQVQCTCAAGMIGDGYDGCAQPLQQCNSYCQCDEQGAFCAQTCNFDAECTCGQKCSNGKCRTKCQPGACPAGQLCQRGACVAGCRTNQDCPSERSCINRLCLDPCLRNETCGGDSRAACRVVDHRAYCTCPDGTPKDGHRACAVGDCRTDEQCPSEMQCDRGLCRNPCLQDGACGRGAQCRVEQRRAQCLCPPGQKGDARVACVGAAGCAESSCGPNAECRDLVGGGVECVCGRGCVGNPLTGCLCMGDSRQPCQNQQCGVNAACRVNQYDQAECYCPAGFPHGDPLSSCECCPVELRK